MSRIVVDQQLIENCLFAFNFIRNTKIKSGVSTYDLASALDKALQENKTLGFIAWSTDNVLSVRPNLTQMQAEEVLKCAIETHDLNVGINWDALKSAADALFPPVGINDKYAEAIIAGDPTRYDAIEVHGVRTFHDTEHDIGTYYEVDDENPELYSVYLHCVAGGIECVGDFFTLTLATKYAEELSQQYQWKVLCFCDEVI